MDYSRIESSVDMDIIRNSHIVVIGAGGSYSLVTSLARTGIGKLTVIDFDRVDPSNVVRQGYKQSDIGKFKVDALGVEVKSINTDIQYAGLRKNLFYIKKKEIDQIFSEADLLLFLTDDFHAQAYGNLLALEYNKPAIWAGWYEQSRTCELFFQVPDFTTACFRCACSSRYIANEKEVVKASSNSNTIFHSQLLDSFIGITSLAILHRDFKNKIPRNIFGTWGGKELEDNKEYELFWEQMKMDDGTVPNFFQFKAHPLGGNKLFDNAYEHLGMTAHNFIPYWQKADAELIINGYDYDCPDCNGKLHHKCNNVADNQQQSTINRKSNDNQ
ncbi:MAG: ThiF family adenylyltransferase [Bergeyella sp.]